MSLMDAMDDALLGADDDELDYDLEKDEEDALLADDNYEDAYDETQGDENREEEPSQIEEDILDIDSNVRLDETEEDFGDQSLKENINAIQLSTKNEPEEEEEIEEQKERNRFTTERNITVQRSTSNDIPDTLEKVSVPPVPQPHNNHRNGKFQRGNRGRGRGRQNHNRGSVFGRVGNPPTEGKTVLINPHFRGNVQASENARLVWDSNFQNFPQQRYPVPQAQVAPFQSQPPQWANPYSDPNANFNQHPAQPNYQEPPPPIQYNHQPEMINPGIRPLMQVSTQPPPFIPQQAPPQQPMGNWSDDQSYCDMFPQGNFRGQNTRYLNQQGHQPLIMNNPPNFNQQNTYPGRNNFNFADNQNIPNQNRPYINPNHPNVPPLIQMQQNYPPPPPQNFDQPPPFSQQTHFNQNRHVQPVYDQYNDPNQFQPINQFPSPMQNNQNFQAGNFQPPASYDPNFIPNQPAQESFPPKQYNHQYNKQNNYPRHSMNQYNRSPPKRRSFENSSGSGDLHKKKKRSMEFSNLHEVPTVEIPDTTTEEKEEEDEDTKKLRLQIEEQKKLREIIIQQKEERRKAAAALKAASENTSVSAPAGNLITTIKTINQPVQQFQQQPQQIQAVKQPNPQFRPPQQNHYLQQKNLQLQRQKQLMQRKTQNQQHPHNIQVQTNQGRGHQQQRRIQQQQSNQANIVITQKSNQPQQIQHPQRIVVLNQQQQKASAIRRVVLKGMNTVTETSTAEKSGQENRGNENLSSFLSNRKVISNSAETTVVELNPTLVDTPVVVVSNLAAGTTDVKIRKLCQGLGPIQNIQMSSNQRQATIRFKTIISAHKFFKKYQRKIVDLSMIKVSLVPES